MDAGQPDQQNPIRDRRGGVAMKITGVETVVLKKTVEHPVLDSLHTYDVGGHLLTRVYSEM